MKPKEKEKMLNILANYLLERYLEEHPDEFQMMLMEHLIEGAVNIPWVSEWSAN